MPSSVRMVNLDKKYRKTLFFPRLSRMVRSNYCNNKHHLIIPPMMSSLFIKYPMEE
jgi:hypothetical protein